MPAILSWLLSAFGSAVGYSVVRFAAWKIFVWTMVITVLPIIISAVIYTLISTLITTVGNVNTQYGGINSFTINFTGLAAWFATHLRLVEGFAMIMSAIIFRMAIRMIPFVRL